MIAWFAKGAELRPHPYDPDASGQPYHGPRSIIAKPRTVTLTLDLDFGPMIEAIDRMSPATTLYHMAAPQPRYDLTTSHGRAQARQAIAAQQQGTWALRREEALQLLDQVLTMHDASTEPSLEEALRNAQPGDVIKMDADLTPRPYRITGDDLPDGTPAAPIIITVDPDQFIEADD